MPNPLVGLISILHILVDLAGECSPKYIPATRFKKNRKLVRQEQFTHRLTGALGVESRVKQCKLDIQFPKKLGTGFVVTVPSRVVIHYLAGEPSAEFGMALPDVTVHVRATPIPQVVAENADPLRAVRPPAVQEPPRARNRNRV